MNQELLKKESRKWVQEGIITEEQKDKILGLYPKRNGRVLLLLFASLFIGLGFLTFIASNWSLIPDLAKMTIILFFMLGFYLIGEHVYRNRTETVGICLIIIGLFVFGAGIFLTGQLYNYMYFAATPFVIWSVAGFCLFAIYQRAPLFAVAIFITTVGQLYSAAVYSSFNYWLFLLLVFAFGHFTYHHARYLYSYLFVTSFMIQSLVFTFLERFEYIWFVCFMLVIYFLSRVANEQSIKIPFYRIGVLSMFVWNIFHIFILNGTYFLSWEMEYNFVFLVVWFVLFGLILVEKIWRKSYEQLTEVVLFLPIFYFPFGDMIAMLALFIFSLGLLLNGYQVVDTKRIYHGTFAFLISTFIAYVQLAWAFLNKSLFFFIGGILLFTLSYLLERKRRQMKSENKEETTR
ncbi:DUF2157 domain-containing protein [Aquibacillus salsiterrae]|uniref:DUF2157 domain-containing protein n=1 Tax=Aquibacillus salsiterrae TaxID=2950439 RepID=A0A9X4AEV9_9BACI|nr:DUF2157 domain-containing protein [Aquibacillus salsiterrae]MDC3417236.1 DUF2157 domain-containing protein [Aquibacillus salsiterrae]